MKDLRSKKAIAASLSLTLALGGVPAVALADEPDQDANKPATQAATDTDNYVNVKVSFVDENWKAIPSTDIDVNTNLTVDAKGYLGDYITLPSGYEYLDANPVDSIFNGSGSAYGASQGDTVTVRVKKTQQATQEVNFTYAVGYGDSQKEYTATAEKGSSLLDALADFTDKAKAAAPEGTEFSGWGFSGSTGIIGNDIDDILLSDSVWVEAKYAPKKAATEEGVNVTIEFVDEQGNTLGATDGFTATYRNQTIKTDGKTDLQYLIQVPEGYDVNFVQNKGSESYVFAKDGDTLLAQVKKHVDVVKHTLTVDMGGASATVDVEDGTTYYDALKPYEQSAKDNAAAAGKKFIGWGMYGDDSMHKISLTDEVKGDAAVYAMFEDVVSEHTVTVNSGTSTLGTVTVKDGDSLKDALAGYEQQAKGNAPSGKEFIGWATLVNGKFVPVVATTTVSSNVQVYAQYEDKFFTVDVFGGEGYGEEIDAASVKKDKNLLQSLSAYTDKAKSMAPEGQKFIGWAWSNGDLIDSNTTVTGDISVYAKYAAVESYTLSIGGMSDDPYAIQKNVDVAEGVNINDVLSAYQDEAEAAAPAGKEFAGWTWSDGTAVAEDATMAADVAVYASYKDVESYDVHVIYGSDTINPAETISVKKGANLLEALDQCSAAAEDQAPEGKGFSNWQYSEGVDINAEDTVMGEMTVQAKYVDAEYTVSVSVGYGDDQVEAAQLTAGYDANLLDTIGQDEDLLADAIAKAPEGMRFTGWGMYGDEGLVPFDASTTVRSDLAVYAMYEEVASHQVNIYYGGDETTPKASPALEEGANLLDELDAYTDLAKENAPEGKQFTGWGWTDNEGTVPVPADATVTGDGINVYAMYEAAPAPAEKVTVKFVDNFNKTTNTEEIEKGATATQPTDPSYPGYTFKGWSSTLGDDGKDFNQVDFTQPVNEDVTYYAFYVKNETPKADDNGNQGATTDNNGNQGATESTEATTAADNQATGEQEGTDQSSEAPQTSDATNAAAVAGIGGIAGLLAAAAALLRRRRNN